MQGQTVWLDTGLVVPKKSNEFLLHMLKNAENDAELQSFDVNSLVIEHIQLDKAPKMWCRIYRVQGGRTPTELPLPH